MDQAFPLDEVHVQHLLNALSKLIRYEKINHSANAADIKIYKRLYRIIHKADLFAQYK